MARQSRAKFLLLNFFQNIFPYKFLIIVFYPVGTIRTTGNVRPKIPGILKHILLTGGKR